MIEAVNIPFDSSWKNVAISLSGGADSALLAYLICELAKDQDVTVHIITHVRMWKTRPWQQHDAGSVYKDFIILNLKDILILLHRISNTVTSVLA